MNKDSGETIGQIPVPGGSFMSPNIWNNRIIIANQRGELLVINPENGNVESQIVTQALQPVATRVGVYSNYAVFGGRKGNVVAANLSNGTVLWQRNVNGTINTDITTGPNGCYIFLDNTITGMSWNSGDNLFSPIASASCAPLLSDGKLYYGTTGGQFIIANASNGRVERRLDVGSAITATPVKTGDYIAVVAGGELLIINPEGIVP
jgi:outer membrane protein assembly factor BamB